MSKPAAIVLAAGQGTRMKSNHPKVLHPVMGRPMVQLVIDTLRVAGVGRVVVVIGRHAERVRAALQHADVEFVVQEEQLGTGHAAMQAESLLAHHEGPVIVACGDAPLLRPDTVTDLLAHHADADATATVLSAVVPDATGYGRIVRDETTDELLTLVEHADATAAQRDIREINSGTYCFHGPSLFAALRRIRPDNVQGEYYLPDAVLVLADEGHTVAAMAVADADEVLGINDRVDLARAEAVLRRRIVHDWMVAGVTVSQPETVYIEPTVQIEADATILPHTRLCGHTVVHADAFVGPDAEVEDSHIAPGATVERSVVRESRIGENCVVGPFTHLRPGTVLESDVRAGAFVELKEAKLAPGAKVGHLAYVGDATLGNNVNIGAGVITCNYDGFEKHETIVGDDAFIGSNANLVAPVEIGSGAFVGAGSTITRDVADDALAVERAEQAERVGWAARKRREFQQKQRDS